MIFGEKIKLKVYVNQHDFVSDIQTPSSIINCFLHQLLMSSTSTIFKVRVGVTFYQI
jgi:hypothetical protein